MIILGMVDTLGNDNIQKTTELNNVGVNIRKRLVKNVRQYLKSPAYLDSGPTGFHGVFCLIRLCSLDYIAYGCFKLCRAKRM